MTSNPDGGTDSEAGGNDGMVDLAPALMDATSSPALTTTVRRKAGRQDGRNRPDPTRTRATPHAPWGQVAAEDDPVLLASEREPAVLCALLMLRDALVRERGFVELAGRPGTVSVIHVPDRAWGRCIADAWDLVVHALESTADSAGGSPPVEPRRHRSMRVGTAFRRAPDTDKGTDQFQIYEKRGKAADGVDFLRDAIARGKAVHILTSDPDGLLAPDVLVAEAQRLHIPPLSLDMLAALALLNQAHDRRSRGRLIRACEGLSDTAAEISPLLLNVAYRASQTPRAFLQQLDVLLAKRKILSPVAPPHPALTLDGLPGLGAAGEWGRQLAADLRSYADGTLPWSELDRGVVLEGPPGSGKSTFARALAGSAGIPLVASSLAQWQGHREGHLGSLLSAMQSTFSDARKSAPCVLLIDEIDSFPSRPSVTHRHKDYVIEVVNALLEQLDGAVGRVGVFVIGTCNDSGNLDPALTRSGRLERIVRVGRPDAMGVEQILRVHLGDALRDEDLKPLAVTAVMRQAVGADVEAWCRGARRRARLEGRPMALADLVEEIGPPPPVHVPAVVKRMAVHEAGHAVAFAGMGPGVLQEVVVDPLVGARSVTTVDTMELYRGTPHATRAESMVQIRAALAGRAAEEVILGDPSGGAGGTDRSDLARATRIACMIVASSGLDDHPDALVYMSPAEDHRRLDQLLLLPDIRLRVSDVLRHAYEDALAMIRASRVSVERIADVLVVRGALSGQEAKALMADAPSSAAHRGEHP